MGIGDGWIDPVSQYPSYSVYGYQEGLIDFKTYELLNELSNHCVALLNTTEYDKAYLGFILF